VIHEGTLKSAAPLQGRSEAKCKHGFECGMAFENYDRHQQVGDIVECFEMEEVARELA
jgi:translation initiation factor IF-2